MKYLVPRSSNKHCVYSGVLRKIRFFRVLKISGKICSRCYELPRDLFTVFKEC